MIQGRQHMKGLGKTAWAALGAGLVLTVAITATDTALAADGFAKAPIVRDGPAAPEPWARYKGWRQNRWDEYNDLAHLTRSPAAPTTARKIAAPMAGDPAKGKQLAFDRSRGGGCLACHVMGPETQELPGNVGPDLSLIGETNPDDEYLFNYVWDPRVYNPESTMPPWGAHGFYTEEEVGHIVAFLKSLKTPATFRNELDDPARRPIPVEDRDWTDPFVNPAAEAFDNGPALYATAGPSGKSCATCHQDADAFKGWAATMPRFHDGMGKVMGVEEFVYRHAKATTGADHRMQSPENLTLSIYLRSLSNGMPIQVDTGSPGAKQAMARAETLMVTKIGQLNFACVDCHSPDKGANKWLRGQLLGESAGQIPHFPVWRTSRNEVWDIRKRLQWCNVQVRANELPPDAPEYDVLELYLTSQSNGLAYESPGIRH